MRNPLPTFLDEPSPAIHREARRGVLPLKSASDRTIKLGELAAIGIVATLLVVTVSPLGTLSTLRSKPPPPPASQLPPDTHGTLSVDVSIVTGALPSQGNQSLYCGIQYLVLGNNSVSPIQSPCPFWYDGLGNANFSVIDLGGTSPPFSLSVAQPGEFSIEVQQGRYLVSTHSIYYSLATTVEVLPHERTLVQVSILPATYQPTFLEVSDQDFSSQLGTWGYITVELPSNSNVTGPGTLFIQSYTSLESSCFSCLPKSGSTLSSLLVPSAPIPATLVSTDPRDTGLWLTLRVPSPTPALGIDTFTLTRFSVSSSVSIGA